VVSQEGTTKSTKWGSTGITTSILHESKEVPTGNHYGEIPKTPSGKSPCCGASLKCLYFNAHSVGNRHDELEICVWLQGYTLIGTTETWWDGSCGWSVATEGYTLFSKDGLGRQGGGLSFL